jgi:hypothetical protein
MSSPRAWMDRVALSCNCSIRVNRSLLAEIALVLAAIASALLPWIYSVRVNRSLLAAIAVVIVAANLSRDSSVQRSVVMVALLGKMQT